MRPALLALLAATAVLYLWALGSSGWANDYYAAAAQAGTQDWKAWLFGSLDSGNAITVDKPPAALWVMASVGQDLRLQRVHDAAAAGVDGRRRRRGAVRGGAPLQRTGGGSDRGRGTRADTGGGVDVPVQQPRRAAGVAAGRGRVLHGAGHRDGEYALDRAWRAASSASRS